MNFFYFVFLGVFVSTFQLFFLMVYNTTQHENVDCHKSSVVVIPRLLRLVLRDYFPVVILLILLDCW